MDARGKAVGGIALTLLLAPVLVPVPVFVGPAAATLHACRTGDSVSYQSAPCAYGAREIRRIEYVPAPAAMPRLARDARPAARKAAPREPRRRASDMRGHADACEGARAARERLLGRNQQGGTFGQRQAAHEAVADACY